MRSFEDSLNAHKSELTEALIVFGEHKRVGKALAELETQRPEFYKFYKDGQESRQNEVDELQRRNQMLNDNIKEQGQKLVYQNEVIETQAEKLLCLRDEKAELQKRVDAARELIAEIKDGYFGECYEVHDIANKLERAFKGGIK